jgi:hypothetical protein
MKKSSMFLRNVTCIDHAYINQVGKIVGGSFHQEIIVTGPVDEHEQVVVDFSAVKKQIKQIIDSKENGYDHKLWYLDHYSDAKMSYTDTSYDITKIDSKYFSLVCPSNAIKFVQNTHQLNTVVGILQIAIAEDLTKHLNMLNNTDKITVDVTLTEDTFGINHKKFTYFHGLKHSTSWGCKNIAHGHTSFSEVYDDTGARILEVEDMIAHYLNESMLVYSENLTDDNVVEYATERGRFKLETLQPFKRIVMDEETTIENIVDHVCEKFALVFDYYAVNKVFISEGLQKGALKIIN